MHCCNPFCILQPKILSSDGLSKAFTGGKIYYDDTAKESQAPGMQVFCGKDRKTILNPNLDVGSGFEAQRCPSEFELWAALPSTSALSALHVWVLPVVIPSYICGNHNPGFLLDESPAFFEAPRTPSSPQPGSAKPMHIVNSYADRCPMPNAPRPEKRGLIGPGKTEDPKTFRSLMASFRASAPPNTES